MLQYLLGISWLPGPSLMRGFPSRTVTLSSTCELQTTCAVSPRVLVPKAEQSVHWGVSVGIFTGCFLPPGRSSRPCVSIVLSLLYWLARTFITKCPKLSGLSIRKLLSPGSGGWSSEIKVSAALVPPDGCDGGLCSGLVCCTCRRLSSPHVSSHAFPLGVLVSVSKFLVSIRTALMLD